MWWTVESKAIGFRSSCEVKAPGVPFCGMFEAATPREGLVCWWFRRGYLGGSLALSQRNDLVLQMLDSAEYPRVLGDEHRYVFISPGGSQVVCFSG